MVRRHPADGPIEQLAILRLDGDLYESTMDALVPLYEKVSPGGFVIVDDYGAWEPCRKAVDDFRAQHGITDEIVEVDWTGVYWRSPETGQRRHRLRSDPRTTNRHAVPCPEGIYDRPADGEAA